MTSEWALASGEGLGASSTCRETQDCTVYLQEPVRGGGGGRKSYHLNRFGEELGRQHNGDVPRVWSEGL